MKRSNYISDGYTCPAFVKGVPLLYEDFRFSFRPMLTDERAAMIASFGQLKPDAVERKAMDTIAKRITSWELIDDKAAKVEVSGHACRRLPPSLWERVYRIVIGQEACDVDPNWPEETVKELDDYQFDATNGKEIGQAREELQAKN